MSPQEWGPQRCKFSGPFASTFPVFENENLIEFLMPWQLCWDRPSGQLPLKAEGALRWCIPQSWSHLGIRFFKTVVSCSPRTSNQQDRLLNREKFKGYIPLCMGKYCQQQMTHWLKSCPHFSCFESPQKQLIGLACPILAHVCPASPATTPSRSTHCILLHHHTQLMIWVTVCSSWDPAAKTPTVVCGTSEATLKPRSQISLQVILKCCLNWRINRNLSDWVPVSGLVKWVHILLWTSWKQRVIASGKASAEFHEYIQREDSCALHTSYAHPRHQMGRFPCRAVRRRNDYHRVVRLTKQNLGEKKGREGLGEAVWQDPFWEADPTVKQK